LNEAASRLRSIVVGKIPSSTIEIIDDIGETQVSAKAQTSWLLLLLPNRLGLAPVREMEEDLSTIVDI
jgi:hypothetical protein